MAIQNTSPCRVNNTNYYQPRVCIVTELYSEPDVAARSQRITRGWRGDVLALFAGALLPLAYAPFNFFPLAVLAPAALFYVWLQSTPRGAARRGLLFGIGLFGIGVSWVFVSMYGPGGVGLGLSIFLTVLMVLVLALFPALLGYLVRRYFTRAGARWQLLVIFPAAWVVCEWVRGWFLTGFPWLLLGYSQIDAPLAGIAPLAGVYGVSLLVALSAGGLVMVLRAPRGAERAVYFIALTALWLGAGAFKSRPWTQPVDGPLRVTLLQGNIPQDLKWVWDLRGPTIDLYSGLTREHWDSELIVWPETALPDFFHNAEPFLDGLAAEAREHGADLLLGVLYQDPATERYYNSMVSVGEVQNFYHKRHLVPFTEYLPMKKLLGGIIDFMQVPMSDFSAGSDPRPLPVAGQKVGISICYEDAFGEEVIQGLPEATLLVNVSNDAWFGESIAPHQHLQIARMRALETGRPLLRATNTGISAVIDAGGRVQAIAPQFEIYALSASVQPMRGATPYVLVGNTPLVIALLLMLSAGAVNSRRARSAP